ncbi:MAG: DUF3891 domain-containing protein, partial [Candidatus Brocadia sp.]
IPRWLDEKRVCLSSFPFEKEVEVVVLTKAVAKAKIKAVGIAQAYAETTWTERKVSFVQA